MKDDKTVEPGTRAERRSDAPGARPATRRARFAAWRRSRPFWGGVLMILAGLVLWLSGRLQFDSFELQLGIEGMQSTLLPVALVLLGVLVMVQPQFRVFYGVIALAISVYSLMGVNLGGFGIGMILGVVGAILALSWLPRVASSDAQAGTRADAAADDGEDERSSGQADPDEANAEAFGELLAFDDEARRGRRSAAVVAAVAVLAIGGTGASAVTASGAVPAAGVHAASDCWDPLGWLEWACGGDDDTATTDPSASPSPSATEGTGDTGDTGAGDTGTGDGDAGAGATGGDAGAGTTGGDAGAEATDGSGDGTSAGGAGSGGTGGEEGTPGSAAGKGATDDTDTDDTGDTDDKKPTSEKEARESVEEQAELELGPCARLVFGGEFDITIALPGDCGRREDANVFSRDAELETRDLQLPLDGINGIDVVNVPVTNDGPRRDALRLSVDSVKVPGFWLKTYADNDGTLGGTITDADYVSMQGNAQMYISSISANLPDGEDLAELGTKLGDGASLVEILLGLVDARIGLMGATSDVQVWSGFREQVWED